MLHPSPRGRVKVGRGCKESRDQEEVGVWVIRRRGWKGGLSEVNDGGHTD